MDGIEKDHFHPGTVLGNVYSDVNVAVPDEVNINIESIKSGAIMIDYLY